MNRKPLDQHIVDEPSGFQFFQAVRLLEKIYPELKAVGKDALPHEEIVRFRSRVTLDFPASEIHEFRPRNDETDVGAPYEMLVNFMGLVGVSGVLPRAYSDLVLDRIRYRDTALWSFLDIFTHRSVSLFYKAWAKYRFPIGYERGNDDFTSSLMDLVGLGTGDLRGHMSLANGDESLLPYAGLITQKPHSVNAVENVLSDYFSTTARVDQFFGQWLKLSEQDTVSLGKRNHVLGRTAIAGSSIWDHQSKFRLRLGPLTLEQFQAFLPNGSAHSALGSILRFMVGLEFDFDVQLILMRTQVPASILTTRAKRRPMLGWTSFLKTTPVQEDDEQLVLSLNA